MSTPAGQDPEEHTLSTQTATKARTNTYAGKCSACGYNVAAQAGLLGGKVNGRWTVRHSYCADTASTPAVASPARRGGYARPSIVGGRRSCITGGNCSSFGDGRDCGGYDCDGY